MVKEKWKPFFEEEVGRIELETRDVVVRKMVFEKDGEEFIDIRTWLKEVGEKKYTGWSKGGVSLPKESLKELVEMLDILEKK